MEGLGNSFPKSKIMNEYKWSPHGRSRYFGIKWLWYKWFRAGWIFG